MKIRVTFSFDSKKIKIRSTFSYFIYSKEAKKEIALSSKSGSCSCRFPEPSISRKLLFFSHSNSLKIFNKRKQQMKFSPPCFYGCWSYVVKLCLILALRTRSFDLYTTCGLFCWWHAPFKRWLASHL